MNCLQWPCLPSFTALHALVAPAHTAPPSTGQDFQVREVGGECQLHPLEETEPKAPSGGQKTRARHRGEAQLGALAEDAVYTSASAVVKGTFLIFFDYRGISVCPGASVTRENFAEELLAVLGTIASVDWSIDMSRTLVVQLSQDSVQWQKRMGDALHQAALIFTGVQVTFNPTWTGSRRDVPKDRAKLFKWVGRQREKSCKAASAWAVMALSDFMRIRRDPLTHIVTPDLPGLGEALAADLFQELADAGFPVYWQSWANFVEDEVAKKAVVFMCDATSESHVWSAIEEWAKLEVVKRVADRDIRTRYMGEIMFIMHHFDIITNATQDDFVPAPGADWEDAIRTCVQRQAGFDPAEHMLASNMACPTKTVFINHPIADDTSSMEGSIISTVLAGGGVTDRNDSTDWDEGSNPG